MMDNKEKESAGISPGLVRFSVGYVGTFEQKWSQFTKAYSEM
jgi:methionine-gamma-lyase